MTIPAFATWVPPEHSDALQIYEELANDRREARFEESLAKTRWFHEHVLEHDPGMKGVRVSFALDEWMHLAETYPPAMVAMKSTRDRAEDNVKKGGDVARALGDAVALNRALEDGARSVELFKWLDANHPALARANFALVYLCLVEAGEYALCGKCIDADQLLNSAERVYRNVFACEEVPPDVAEMVQSMGTAHFSAEAATIVAILVIDGKPGEARRIAAAAREVVTNDDMEAALASALDGNVPAPWPDMQTRAQARSLRAELRKAGR